MQNAVSLFISQERILRDVLPALVLECGEESGRGCGGVEFLADVGKFGGILLNLLGVDAQRTSVRQLAVDAPELDGNAVSVVRTNWPGSGQGSPKL